MFCFSIFVCCRRICDSNLSSYQGFDFLSVVFRDTPIFSLTNFAPAYIKSFNSMMLFVQIFVNKSFTFLVSNLTVLQSWFLREGNVVFFSDVILFMTLFMILTFIYLSSVSICIFVFAVFRSLSFSVRFLLAVSGFPEFCVSVTVLGVY